MVALAEAGVPLYRRVVDVVCAVGEEEEIFSILGPAGRTCIEPFHGYGKALSGREIEDVYAFHVVFAGHGVLMEMKS